MNDIEQKALWLLNEVAIEECEEVNLAPHKSLCAALRLSVIEHEDTEQAFSDFRQEVSDVVTSLCNTLLMGSDHSQICEMLSRRFIIPKPKPDPLVDVAKTLGVYNTAAKHWAGDVRAALDALGFEIREKNDG